MPVSETSGAAQVAETINRIEATLAKSVSAEQFAEVQAAIRDLTAGREPVGEATVASEGIRSFRTRDGALRLVDAHSEFTVTMPDGQKVNRSVRVPGLLSSGTAPDSALADNEKAAVKRYSKALGAVNILARTMQGGMPFDHLHALTAAADAAPASMRAELTAHANQVAENFGRRMSATFSATPLSTATGSGNPGYSWVADTYLPEMVDVTDSIGGLAQMLQVLGGGSDAGLHPTANIKVRVLTGIGGYARNSRYIAAGSPTYAEAAISTDTLSLTGDNAVWASPLDGVDLSDPRAILDEIALMQQASMKAGLAQDDLALLHGDKQALAASHGYAAAGLQMVIADGRATGFAGQDNDPLLIEDGILAWAADRSTNVDVVAGTSLSAAADMSSSQANFLIGHNYLKQLLSAQYRRRNGFAIVADQRVADKLNSLNSTTSVPVFTYATDAEVAANPWLAGRLMDGTLVLSHDFVQHNYAATGIPTSGSALDVLNYVSLAAVFMVKGGLDDMFSIDRIPGSDKVLVSRRRNRALWLPVPSTKVPVVRGYNVSFA